VDFSIDFLKEPCLWHIEADMPAGFVEEKHTSGVVR
jgi:hypothetical protein